MGGGESKIETWDGACTFFGAEGGGMHELCIGPECCTMNGRFQFCEHVDKVHDLVPVPTAIWA